MMLVTVSLSGSLDRTICICHGYSMPNQCSRSVSLSPTGLTLMVPEIMVNMPIQVDAVEKGSDSFTIWGDGSWDSLFPTSMSPNCKLMSPEHYF